MGSLAKETITRKDADKLSRVRRAHPPCGPRGTATDVAVEQAESP